VPVTAVGTLRQGRSRLFKLRRGVAPHARGASGSAPSIRPGHSESIAGSSQLEDTGNSDAASGTGGNFTSESTPRAPTRPESSITGRTCFYGPSCEICGMTCQ
jgi:hypothetical protein